MSRFAFNAAVPDLFKISRRDFMIIKMISLIINTVTIIYLTREFSGYHDNLDNTVFGILLSIFILNILVILFCPNGYEYFKEIYKRKKLEQEIRIKELENTFK